MFIIKLFYIINLKIWMSVSNWNDLEILFLCYENYGKIFILDKNKDNFYRKDDIELNLNLR